MDDKWFNLIVACIPVIGAILTGFIIPWIKIQINAEKLNTYIEWTKKAVTSAQQIYTPEEWREKKDYCLAFLEKQFGFQLTYEQREILIESAVKELKLMEKEVEK